MLLDDPTKLTILLKAADIVIQAVSSGQYVTAPDAVELLEKTYSKMISLAKEA